jgi:hypothetical protein
MPKNRRPRSWARGAQVKKEKAISRLLDFGVGNFLNKSTIGIKEPSRRIVLPRMNKSCHTPTPTSIIIID